MAIAESGCVSIKASAWSSGTIILSDKSRADSILNLCTGFDELSEEQRYLLKDYML